MAKKKSPSGGDYEVGYGKPPKETRFKAGQSGNPRGRPKATKNVEQLLMDRLMEKIAVTENGKSRLVPRVDAYFLALFARAVKGDPKAGEQLLKLMAYAQRGSPQGAAETAAEPGGTEAVADLDQADQEILAYFAAQIRGDAAGGEEPQP